MADAGAAVVLADAELTAESLRAEVDAIALDPERLRAMSAASARLARPDAAREIAAEVLAAARGS
jgi:UDP-N-acetylglucosamine--N-acetylmuramyl-(pentapeptide) pyrophosphoryl-undecaprenol N-acetylglucosamine transferase